ncbi:endonuclease domain-containing protein [Arthrobacter sp. NPDC056727]|uniref:endonuclease domain-containing protein n=1 Tax=Arthrobacter sp. NPDC056727 TaxID=3345927 RepID=UPI0036724DB2
MGLSELPQDLAAGSFTTSDAAARGISRKRQRQPDLAMPSRGIRVPLGGEATTAANLRAYTASHDASTLTHHCGARIWGYGLPGWMQEDWRIHVARERGGSKPRRRNVVGHRMTFKPGEVVIHDGVRVTSPARTWLDLAGLLTVDELIAAGDSAVVAHGPEFPVPRAPLTTVDALQRMVAAHPGMRGIKTARLALPEIRVGADSPQETRMRLILARTKLGEPVLNYIIRNTWGQPAVWPDAAYPEHCLALQYDGGHHSDPVQAERDRKRQELTERLGWTELRIFKDDLDGEKPFVLEKVRATLQGRLRRRASGTWDSTP